MGKLDALWLYQEAELVLDRLENAIRSTPSRVKLLKLRNFLMEQQNTLSHITDETEAKRALIQQMVARNEELELDYQKEQQAFDNLAEPTLQEVTAAREKLEHMLDEITEVRRDTYDVMLWLEKANDTLSKTWQKASSAKKEYDIIRATCEKEQEDAMPEIEKAKQVIEECAKNVDKDLLARYKNIKRTHAVPIATVENDQCSGCNMSLPVVIIRRIKDDNRVVECENCGRILYLK